MEHEKKGEMISPDQQALIAKSEADKLERQIVDVVIKSDTDLKSATELLVRVKQIGKNIKGQKDPIIRDLNSSISRIRALFKPAEERIAEAEARLKAAILEYHDKVEKRAARSADRIEGKVDSGELGMAEGMGKLANVKQAQNVVHTESGSAQIRVTKKISIIDVGSLPPSYFLRPRVIEALRIEVAEDVLRKKLPVPPGAQLYEEKGVAGVS